MQKKVEVQQSDGLRPAHNRNNKDAPSAQTANVWNATEKRIQN